MLLSTDIANIGASTIDCLKECFGARGNSKMPLKDDPYAFNQRWLGAVNTTPNSSNFGAVNTENSVPRLMRLGLKVKF